jgi:hypothetical protein
MRRSYDDGRLLRDGHTSELPESSRRILPNHDAFTETQRCQLRRLLEAGALEVAGRGRSNFSEWGGPTSKRTFEMKAVGALGETTLPKCRLGDFFRIASIRSVT